MPEFRWRREAPSIALLALLALVARVAVAQQIERYLDADTALVASMAQHIARGERFPVFCYGNDYMAATVAYAAAPFHAALGADPRGLAYAQALILALLGIPILYRLTHAVGGRAGAVMAGLFVALGTPDQLYGTTGMLIGYLDLLIVGAALYVLALPRLCGTTVGGAAAIGLALGLGWTSNPQIASVALALGVGWWSHGRAAALLAGPPAPWRRPARAVAGGLAAAILLSVFFAIVRLQAPLLGVLSVAHGEKYLQRFAGLAAAIAIAAEVALAPRKWVHLARVASFTTGTALGGAPWLHAKWIAPAAPMRALMRLEPARWLERHVEVTNGTLDMLGGPAAPHSSWGAPWPEIDAALRALALATLAASALGLVVARRRQLVALVTVRPVPLAPETVVALQLPLLALLIGGYPNPIEPRYFLAMWLPAMCVVAWAAGQLARRSALALVLAFAPLVLNGAAQWGGLVAAPPLDRHPSDRRHLIAHLEREGPRAGYAEYFNVHDLVYLSDERLLVHPFKRNTNRQPWIGQRIVREAPSEVFVLLRAPDDTVDECQRLLARHGASVAARRCFGAYTLYALVLPVGERGLHPDWSQAR